MPDDLSLLMVLRVQGIASVERACVALGVAPSEGARQLASLVGGGLASERTGRVAGFTLTSNGLERLEKLLADEGLRTSEELAAGYEWFMSVDGDVKRACTHFQVADRDDAVREIVAVHDRAKVCLRKMSAVAQRYGPYRTRLEACVDRLLDGDLSAFTKPLTESYHQVWWELHQDLLLTLGLEREE